MSEITIIEAAKESVEILSEAKKKVVELLTGHDHTGLLISFEHKMNEVINRVSRVAGLEQMVQEHPIHHYPPVTNFMGEELSLPSKVDPNEMDPNKTAKAAFLKKVNKVYDMFENTPDGIDANKTINNFSLPEEQLVLRGVAKRAGVAEYETKEINEEFINEIHEGVKLKKEANELEQDIDSDLGVDA